MFFGLLAKVFGFNFEITPVDVIAEQLKEPRPLPMGKNDFEVWSRRIIAGAVMPPCEGDEEIAYKSYQHALATMIMHLGPTESHKPDAFFIHSLRKGACNQVAHAFIMEQQAEKRKRFEDEARLADLPDTSQGDCAVQ